VLGGGSRKCDPMTTAMLLLNTVSAAEKLSEQR